MKEKKSNLNRIIALFLSSLLIVLSANITMVTAQTLQQDNYSEQSVSEDSTFVLSKSNIQIGDDYSPNETDTEEPETPSFFSTTDTVGDPMVYLTQKWLNQEYGDIPGFGSVTENGKTGWNVIYGLTRALQHELGITELANNFGPSTKALYAKNPLHRQDGVTDRKFAILQGALWCKGYNPGYYLTEDPETGIVSFEEIFNDKVEKAVISLKTDAGFINPDSVVTPNLMKALLSMDSFKLLSTYYGGTYEVRSMQQKFNRTYEEYIGALVPCDGVYGRSTSKALVFALQAEEGMPVGTATGNFGPATRSHCPQIPYVRNSNAAKDYNGNYYTDAQLSRIIELVQFGLFLNGFGDGIFDGKFNPVTQQAVLDFQSHYALPRTGKVNLDTWMSLFISSGNPNRSAIAADCATILNSAKAKTLYDNGYRYIGRYLTGTYAGGQSKALTITEAKIILKAGLRFFPIYQTSSNSESYFTPEKGISDAQSAITAADALGLPADTIIYFAVDFDAMDYQITNSVIPYFEKVSEEIAKSRYKVGVYGARNVCSRVAKEGYSCSSFVGDMSTGYGKATISATDGNKIESSEVTVKLDVQSVSFQNLVMSVGERTVISPAFTPINATQTDMVYTYEEGTVIKIDEYGVIHALVPGTIIVTGTTSNGVSDTFTITVTDADFTRKSGDVNGDDSVDIIDLVKVKKHIAGAFILTGIDFNTANIDKNGDVNSSDLILLRKILLGIDTE